MKRVALFFALALTACPNHPSTAPDDGGVEAGEDDGGQGSWQVVLQNLDGTLLSVWGASATDVYTVGGPLGNTPYKGLVMHFDGSAWKRIAVDHTDTYWWVHGSGPRDVWMSGSNGRLSHWDGSAFKEYTSGTTATIFGVFAASPTEAWAVGGTPEKGTTAPNDVVLHFDGTSWTPEALPKALGRTYFKVWGTSLDDIYVVGEAGTIWHRAQGAWTLESDPPIAHGTLLTVHGCGPSEIYAVGGRDVLRFDGTAWAEEPVNLLNDVNGVSCGHLAPLVPGSSNVGVLIVGSGGLKERRVQGTWNDDRGTKPYSDLHGAWVDPAGGQWAAGGEFVAPAQPGVTRAGVLAHYGSSPVPSTIVP
jgi:hypothetical protein